MSWLRQLGDTWSELRGGTPGKRFEEQYQRRRERHGPRRKMALMVTGYVLLGSGLVMMLTPIPGIVLLVLGAAILARESRVAALALDRMEVRLRKLMPRAR